MSESLKWHVLRRSCLSHSVACVKEVMYESPLNWHVLRGSCLSHLIGMCGRGHQFTTCLFVYNFSCNVLRRSCQIGIFHYVIFPTIRPFSSEMGHAKNIGSQA